MPMQLYSLSFVLFVLLLLAVYYTVGRRIQPVILLIGSLAFYACIGLKNLLFLLITSVSVYAAGRIFEHFTAKYDRERKKDGITREQKKELKRAAQKKKRAVLLAVIVINLGILAYFKYWNPLLEEFAVLLKQNVKNFPLYRAGSLLLPLGISFYTFQALGYLLDCYNGKYAPEHQYFRLLLFLSWFPQLIQGPINRYDRLGEQLRGGHRFDSEKWKRALLRILFGAMKKYAAADVLSGTIAYIFDHKVDNLSSPVIITGILMYAFQQYCDFSGGIDMVCGVSSLFGIDMAENFRQPYFAVSLADFWRRWHISLGTWMRDYVFYPFALTRPMQRLGKWCRGKLGTHIGKVLPAAVGNVLVFYLVGLWHGSEGHFILWGLYNGIGIALGELLSPVFDRISTALRVNTESRGFHLFRVLRTFVIVNIGWYFDRISDVGACFKCLRNTLLHPDYNLSTVGNLFAERFSGVEAVLPVLTAISLLIVLCDSLLKERGVDVYVHLHKRKLWQRWGLYMVMLLLILASFAYSNGGGGFLYANF